jgi:hypothetical protein
MFRLIRMFLRVAAMFEALDVSKDFRGPLPVTGLQMVCSVTWYTAFTKVCSAVKVLRCHGIQVNVIYVRL